MLLIVGHGPSVNRRLGRWIDTHRVVRLKHGIPVGGDPEVWGTRTDVLCARYTRYARPGVEFWHFTDNGWLDYYARFKPKHGKPSTGLSAVFCAVDRGHREIALIGFDRLMDLNDGTSRKWCDEPAHSVYGHDQRAEHECLYSLGLTIHNLAELHG